MQKMTFEELMNPPKPKGYSIYCDFDMDKHKETYINYLEVIIYGNGKVEYAIPSHQEKLISICMHKYGISRNELNDLCPQEYHFDYLNWLCMQSNCIAVYNNGYIGNPNRFQKHKLKMLKEKKIYAGEI